MATSGTTNYAPNIASLGLQALQRIGIKRVAVDQDHLENLYNESNLMQAAWSADGILFFTVALETQALTQGTATYNIPAGVVNVLDLYINNGSSNRLILPFSRTDYASLANPTTQGFPTSFWWDRALAPTITLWPVPDGNATYTMYYYVYNQTQDAVLAGGVQPAVPYWFLDAYVADLAHRMSRIYAPELEPQRERDRDKAYATAQKQVENAPLYIVPGLAGYFR
jgi:hypothetical protein